MTRDHPFANTPLAQHPFRIRHCGVPIGLRHSSRITCRNHRIENYNHVLILTSPSPCARTPMGLCPAHIVDFPTISLPDCDSGFQPRRPCKRYLPGPFPLSPCPRVQYRWCCRCWGVGGDGYRLGAFSNAGAARAGVGGLPRVLSTKVFVLLRPGGVIGTLAISASGGVGLTLSAASLSASSRSLSLLSAAVSRRTLEQGPGLVGLSSSCPQRPSPAARASSRGGGRALIARSQAGLDHSTPKNSEWAMRRLWKRFGIPGSSLAIFVGVRHYSEATAG